MLKIRLMRIGGRQRPFYRVVAVDERAKRTGGYIELLGTYNPLTSPHEIILKQDRIDHWVKQGAQMSNGFLRIIGKAPQRPPRKAKKEKVENPQEAVKQPVAEQPAEEIAQANTSEVGEPNEVNEVVEETEEVKAPEPVIASTSTELSVNSAKQSNQDENPTQIATVAPEGGPRNDKVEEKEEKKDERPA